MYLIKLIKKNKFLFFLIIGFFFIQIFINAKRGLTATPFLHYGMYSAKAEISDTLFIYKIFVNGKLLRLNDNFPETNDQILGPIKKYFSLPLKGNNIYHSHINKYLSALKIPHRSESFTFFMTELEFLKWYKKRLEKLTKQNVNTLDIFLTKNLFENGHFKMIDSTNVLSWN